MKAKICPCLRGTKHKYYVEIKKNWYSGWKRYTYAVAHFDCVVKVTRCFDTPALAKNAITIAFGNTVTFVDWEG